MDLYSELYNKKAPQRISRFYQLRNFFDKTYSWFRLKTTGSVPRPVSNWPPSGKHYKKGLDWNCQTVYPNLSHRHGTDSQYKYQVNLTWHFAHVNGASTYTIVWCSDIVSTLICFKGVRSLNKSRHAAIYDYNLLENEAFAMYMSVIADQRRPDNGKTVFF